MRPPQGDVLIMIDEKILHIILLGKSIGSSENLEHGCDTLCVCFGLHPAPFEQAPKRIGETWLRKAFAEPSVCKFIRAKCFKDLLVLCARNKFELAKLHRLKSACRVQLIAKF